MEGNREFESEKMGQGISPVKEDTTNWVVKLLGYLSVFLAILWLINYIYRIAYLDTVRLGHMNLELFISKLGIVDLYMTILAFGFWILVVSFIHSGSSSIYNLLNYRLIYKLLKGYLGFDIIISLCILLICTLLHWITVCNCAYDQLSCIIPSIKNMSWWLTVMIFLLWEGVLGVSALLLHLNSMDEMISKITRGIEFRFLWRKRKGLMIPLYDGKIFFYKAIAPNFFFTSVLLALIIIPTAYGTAKANNEIIGINQNNPSIVKRLIVSSNPCKGLVAFRYNESHDYWIWVPNAGKGLRYLGDIDGFSIFVFTGRTHNQTTCLIRKEDVLGFRLSSP